MRGTLAAAGSNRVHLRTQAALTNTEGAVQDADMNFAFSEEQ
ncbi:MAG: hypothetical protein RI908_1045, partial [Actinomycetota bacterium]